MNDWQPIDTAPKDGRKVLLWWRDGVSYWAIGEWKVYRDGERGWLGETFHSDDESWTRFLDDAPTHWMPFPDAPEAK